MALAMWGYVTCDTCRMRSPSGPFDDLWRWQADHREATGGMEGHRSRSVTEPIGTRSETYEVSGRARL